MSWAGQVQGVRRPRARSARDVPRGQLLRELQAGLNYFWSRCGRKAPREASVRMHKEQMR